MQDHTPLIDPDAIAPGSRRPYTGNWPYKLLEILKRRGARGFTTEALSDCMGGPESRAETLDSLGHLETCGLVARDGRNWRIA